ncbi:MAG: FAD/NAD(P)-binding protein [Armatimonadota bacterium]|nr:FAD/NAD(P)-binding protein [Armatimonadota bacterium]MDR7453769.1 FAD/NAD(P)-binding protein [Armatimonadota bacterium]MDR7456297.1 FAD/NAD(P)-binding protein [Armatimonadota bacterium]MDR7496294.1 FAD/NAD(P)-binding protein [Armatimonadota bacterium]MDR7512217.1 FAD/NAD(P)-binding protein [Armatimonadota bacterium]
MTAVGPVPPAPHPLQPHAARLVTVTPEAPGIATYVFELADPALRARYAFAPGQFNMLFLPGIGECAISLSSDAGEPGRLAHTVRAVGSVTRAIARLRPGDAIGLRGPYGSPWPVDRLRGRDLILVAGGIGLAPLRPVVYHLIRHRPAFGRVQLLIGARVPADLLFVSEYQAWRAAEIEVIETVDRADETWTGRVGVVPVLFYQLRPDPRRTAVLTCGPEIMMRFVVYEALARRIPRDAIYLSLERNMKCAVAVCGRCQYGPFFLCKDGPVLSYDRVEPFFSVEEY